MSGQNQKLTCKRCGSGFDRERPRGLPFYCPPCRPVVHNERGKRWVVSNPEVRSKAQRKWLAKNPEKQAAARRRWHENNMEKERASRRAVKKRNPAANRSYVRVRKARQLGSTTVTFSPEQLVQRLAYFGNKCWMCKKDADSIDHVKPLSKGGPHMLSNLRPACLSCNSSKRDRWPLS